MLLLGFPLFVIRLTFDGNWEDIEISSEVVSFASDIEITLEREVSLILEEKHIIPKNTHHM